MIGYLKELEARVEELESCMDLGEYTARPRRSELEMAEQTSNNYESMKIENGKKVCINKRKASDTYEDGLPLNVQLSIREEEVLIQMKCAYREYILLDIMDEINNLHLDVQSVQSSTVDGILTVTLKSKVCAFSSFILLFFPFSKFKFNELDFSFEGQQLHLQG